MKLLIAGLFVALTPLAAQAPKAGVRIGGLTPSNGETLQPGNQVRRTAAVTTPVLGFITGPGPLELRAILGSSANARLSQPLSPPTAAARLFLAPGQRFALIERDHDQPIAVWALDGSAVAGNTSPAVTIPGAYSHPDLIAFSPRATSAALYLSTLDRIQILTGLPMTPVVSREIGAAGLGKLSMIAVSDDGTVLIAKNSVGQAQVAAAGGIWRPLPGANSPAAWSFVPKTHDLVISESEQNAIVLLERVDGPLVTPTPAIIATRLQSDHLQITRDGETAVGFNSREGLLWTLDLKTGNVKPIDSSRPVEALDTLRDGHTFLLSSSPTAPISIVKVPDSSHSSLRVIHPGIAASPREAVDQ